MPWFALLCMLLVVSVAQAADNEPHSKLRVLFVGNSYLYYNDLPRQVQVLAAERGVVVETALLAEPDYSLSDHLRQRRLDPLLEQPWDWVILQQGPSALPESRRELARSARRIAQRLEQTPTRIALMSAWPAQRNAAMSSQAEASYRGAANAISACVLPVATAWRLMLQRSGAPDLYQADRLHPTPVGSLLAALVVTRGLLGTDPFSREEGVAPPLLRLLDEAAQEADSQESARCALVPGTPKQ